METLFTALLAAAMWLSLFGLGCEQRDDGTTPAAETELPPLSLTDDTREVLFTWVDDEGRSHTAVSIGEIPEDERGEVRVITKEAGQGALFYVADLSRKSADGSYPVRTMSRGDWEKRIAARRQAHRDKHAPPVAQPKTGNAPHATAGAVEAIVYGASWCKPCHDAAHYLERRGVKVKQVDVEKEPRFAREMQQKLERAGMRGGSIPVIDIGGIVLQGFSKSALDRAIARLKQGADPL